MGPIDPGIDALHQLDIDGTNKFDLDLLAKLWTDDAVRIINGQIDLSKNQILARDYTSRDETPRGTAQYIPRYQTYPLTDGWAYEFGTFTSLFWVNPPPEGPVLLQFGRVVRLLRRQADGMWKIAWLKAEIETFDAPNQLASWVEAFRGLAC